MLAERLSCRGAFSVAVSVLLANVLGHCYYRTTEEKGQHGTVTSRLRLPLKATTCAAERFARKRL